MGKKIFIIGGRCSGKTGIEAIINSDNMVVNSKGFISLDNPYKDTTTIKHKKRIKHKKLKKNK